MRNKIYGCENRIRVSDRPIIYGDMWDIECARVDLSYNNPFEK